MSATPPTIPPAPYTRRELRIGCHRWSRSVCRTTIFNGRLCLFVLAPLVIAVSAYRLPDDPGGLVVMPLTALAAGWIWRSIGSARKRLDEIERTERSVREWERRQREAGRPI